MAAVYNISESALALDLQLPRQILLINASVLAEVKMVGAHEMKSAS